MKFEFPEDRKYFESLFGVSNIDQCSDFFDFRDPKVKRKEFSLIRKKVFANLIEKHGFVCQLSCHEDCLQKPTQVDHLIPLATNQLNKKSRRLNALPRKKVVAQSFGSNNPINLILACSRCNAFKKHKLPDKDMISRIIIKTES